VGKRIRSHLFRKVNGVTVFTGKLTPGFDFDFQGRRAVPARFPALSLYNARRGRPPISRDPALHSS